MRTENMENAMSEESPQKVFTVYRMNFEDKKKEPVGQIIERRKSSRLNNRIGLLRLARQKFSFGEDEAICIGMCDDWSEGIHDLKFI